MSTGLYEIFAHLEDVFLVLWSESMSHGSIFLALLKLCRGLTVVASVGILSKGQHGVDCVSWI